MAFVMHRYGIFRLDGTAFGLGDQHNTRAGWLPVPGSVHYDDGQDDAFDTYIVPMDDHREDWARLLGEDALRGGRGGDPARLTHSGGTVHPDWPHVQMGGAFTWSEPVTPEVDAIAQEVLAKAEADHAEERTGLDVDRGLPLHPDCGLRLHSGEFHLGYDGSVRVTTHCEVLHPSGKGTGHRESYTHRLAPRAWHTLPFPDMVHAAYVAHHCFKGLQPPEQGDIPLHPRGFPAEGLAAPRDDQDAELHSRIRAAIVIAKERELTEQAHVTAPITIPETHHPLRSDDGHNEDPGA